MSKKVKIILGIAFSFVFCFLAMGYAYLTDTLSLTGDVEGDPQDNIFIVDVFETTTNVTSTSYYANRLLQNISLGADETASYYVQIYNSNNTQCIFDNYYFSQDGISVVVEEYEKESENLVYSTSNVISSLVDSTSFDYFKVTYKNNTAATITVEAPILFEYKEFNDSIKVEFKYDGVTYVKYSNPISGGYEDVTFDKVPIDLTNENNRVARSNNSSILSVEEENGIGILTVSNVTKTINSNGDEKKTSCYLFSTLASASTYNSGEFWDDKTPNYFIVLQNIGESIEPTNKSIEVWGSKNYTINLNSKYLHIYQPIVNDGVLKLYNESSVNLGSITSHNSDLVINVFADSYLNIENLNLTVNQPESSISSNSEYSAAVVSYEGLIEIFNCNIYSEYGNGIYKRPADPGNIHRTKTSAKSKILVESSTVESLRNNAIRLYDGSGYISLVDCDVKSCANPNITYTKYVDPIFCDRHPLEKTDTNEYNYSKFYRYATTELMVYVTGGTLTMYSSDKVNHFYSNADLNSRIFYTKSAKFRSATDETDTVVHARTVNDRKDPSNVYYFPYPVAILNGNSATMDELYEDAERTILSSHYLNSDGWYYIKTTIADVVNDDALDYRTSSYIDSADFANMIHDGVEIKVGSPIEFINFNNPGTSYFDTTGYEGQTHSDYYMGLTAIPSSQTQAQYTGYDYEFIFLASGDEYYYNIVSLGNTKNVFHIENKNIPNTSSSYDKTQYSVGVKYISTDNQWVEADDQAQRFAVMKYMHQYTPENAQPYVFVSQYNSVLSFLQVGTNKDHYVSSIPAWQTTNRFNDTSFTDSLVQAGFIDAAYDKSTGLYTYSDAKYLISNPTHKGYQRNGWYLWQSDLYTEVKYDFTTNTNILNTTLDANRDNGTTITLDSNTKLYISAQATKSNDRGVHLNSVYTNGSEGKDNFGYIRFTSEKEIYGIRIEIERIDITTNISPSNTPYLQFRTYNKAGKRVDYNIIESNAPIGFLKPHNSSGELIYDYDENREPGLPYYAIIEQGSDNSTYVITVLFDSKYSNYDLHSITFDPFDDANRDNTMTIKAITLIHPIVNNK